MKKLADEERKLLFDTYFDRKKFKRLMSHIRREIGLRKAKTIDELARNLNSHRDIYIICADDDFAADWMDMDICYGFIPNVLYNEQDVPCDFATFDCTLTLRRDDVSDGDKYVTVNLILYWNLNGHWGLINDPADLCIGRSSTESSEVVCRFDPWYCDVINYCGDDISDDIQRLYLPQNNEKTKPK